MAVVPGILQPMGLFVSAQVADSDGLALIQACKAAGVKADLIVHDSNTKPSDDKLQRITCALLSVDVIGNSTKSHEEPELATFSVSLRAAPELRWLQVCSVGTDRALYSELRGRNVRISSGAGTNKHAVVQTALAGVLALARGVPHWIASQRQHQWVPLRGPLTPVALEGQHAVVIGMGSIGTDIARLLAALEVHVTGLRRTPAPAAYFDSVLGMDSIDSVLPKADWLVLACPLTPQTRGLLDSRRLGLMKTGARLINIARGEIVDEIALVEALRIGAIGGAYLDVFAREPLTPESHLWDMENVLISPHSAGNSTNHQRNVIELFQKNILRLVNDQPLINECIPENTSKFSKFSLA